MKIRGSKIVVKALEDEGVRLTFGIPGTHNVELYDALEDSERIEPVLVTDEQSASFAADGVSRTSDTIGVVNVVPSAGVTHCLSGVGEAYMDNVPLVVLVCGIRKNTQSAYQVHDVDQLSILRPITKAAIKVEKPEDIYPLVRRAFAIARSQTPGPVAIEIPANFYILHQEIDEPVYKDETPPIPKPSERELKEAVNILKNSRFSALYVGNGARAASALVKKLAETLAAPVTTTIQGKGVFPENHPLWLWNGFGASAPSFVRSIMDRCGCLLAIGCRFGEVATASYGLKTPANLIHVDINDEVFNRNYPAKLAVKSDAGAFIDGLLNFLEPAKKNEALEIEIRNGHQTVKEDWRAHASKDKVSPHALFEALQRFAGEDAIYSTDSGNGTFLAMEHLRLNQPACFIAPVDFSCMGYSVPAAIGAKFANPNRDVIALAGDGALLMTGLELLTASSYRVAPITFVLHDGELAQIAQLQSTTFARKTCSTLPQYSVEAFAKVTNCRFFKLKNDADIEQVLPRAFEIARADEPVLVDVNIDYSQKTYFTKGIMTTNFWRLPWGERLSMLSRAVSRRLVGTKKH